MSAFHAKGFRKRRRERDSEIHASGAAAKHDTKIHTSGTAAKHDSEHDATHIIRAARRRRVTAAPPPPADAAPQKANASSLSTFPSHSLKSRREATPKAPAKAGKAQVTPGPEGTPPRPARSVAAVAAVAAATSLASAARPPVKTAKRHSLAGPVGLAGSAAAASAPRTLARGEKPRTEPGYGVPEPRLALLDRTYVWGTAPVLRKTDLRGSASAALQTVCRHLEGGDIVLISGPAGCGKTSLARLAAALCGMAVHELSSDTSLLTPKGRTELSSRLSQRMLASIRRREGEAGIVVERQPVALLVDGVEACLAPAGNRAKTKSGMQELLRAFAGHQTRDARTRAPLVLVCNDAYTGGAQDIRHCDAVQHVPLRALDDADIRRIVTRTCGRGVAGGALVSGVPGRRALVRSDDGPRFFPVASPQHDRMGQIVMEAAGDGRAAARLAQAYVNEQHARRGVTGAAPPVHGDAGNANYVGGAHAARTYVQSTFRCVSAFLSLDAALSRHKGERDAYARLVRVKSGARRGRRLDAHVMGSPVQQFRQEFASALWTGMPRPEDMLFANYLTHGRDVKRAVAPVTVVQGLKARVGDARKQLASARTQKTAVIERVRSSARRATWATLLSNPDVAGAVAATRQRAQAVRVAEERLRLAMVARNEEQMACAAEMANAFSDGDACMTLSQRLGGVRAGSVQAELLLGVLPRRRDAKWFAPLNLVFDQGMKFAYSVHSEQARRRAHIDRTRSDLALEVATASTFRQRERALHVSKLLDATRGITGNEDHPLRHAYGWLHETPEDRTETLTAADTNALRLRQELGAGVSIRAVWDVPTMGSSPMDWNGAVAKRSGDGGAGHMGERTLLSARAGGAGS